MHLPRRAQHLDLGALPEPRTPQLPHSFFGILYLSASDEQEARPSGPSPNRLGLRGIFAPKAPSLNPIHLSPPAAARRIPQRFFPLRRHPRRRRPVALPPENAPAHAARRPRNAGRAGGYVGTRPTRAGAALRQFPQEARFHRGWPPGTG